MSAPVAEVGGYKNITATGAVSTGACQLIGFYVNNTTIGTLVLRDGGASGTVVFSTATTAAGTPFNVVIPGEGVLCLTDIHVTVSGTATTAVVFYG